MGRANQKSMWGFGGIGPVRLAKRTWHEIGEDDVLGKAAELAYYFLLALFPALLFMVSLLGMMAGPGTEMRDRLFQVLTSVLPPSSSNLVTSTIDQISSAAGGWKLAFGLLTALWAASGGLAALIGALNVAHDVTESRPWWKKRSVAVLLTLELATLTIIALSVVLFGGRVGQWLSGKFGLGEAFALVWQFAQWPLALLAMLTAFASIYYFAPNLRNRNWFWVSPGAVIGLLLWLAVSFGFRLYLQYFNTYSKMYGSLGAVIVLMLWFYLSGLAILVGGEVNSEIDHALEEAEQRQREDEQLDRQLAA